MLTLASRTKQETKLSNLFCARIIRVPFDVANDMPLARSRRESGAASHFTQARSTLASRAGARVWRDRFRLGWQSLVQVPQAYQLSVAARARQPRPELVIAPSISGIVARRGPCVKRGGSANRLKTCFGVHQRIKRSLQRDGLACRPHGVSEVNADSKDKWWHVGPRSAQRTAHGGQIAQPLGPTEIAIRFALPSESSPPVPTLIPVMTHRALRDFTRRPRQCTLMVTPSGAPLGARPLQRGVRPFSLLPSYATR